MSRGKDKPPRRGEDLSEPSLKTAKTKPELPGTSTLVELLGLDEGEEPTRHVQFELPPGGIDFKIDDLSGTPAPPPPPVAESQGGASPPLPPGDAASLFSGLGLDAEESLEIAVHEIGSTPLADLSQKPAERSLTPPGGKESSTPVPAARFARGYTAGRAPLDGSEFNPEEPASRKKKNKKTPSVDRLPRSTAAPMQDSQKQVHRSGLTITTRDIILLLLVIVLAAAVWVVWHVFQQYRAEREIERLEARRTLIEEKKNDALKAKEKQKEGTGEKSPK